MVPIGRHTPGCKIYNAYPIGVCVKLNGEGTVVSLSYGAHEITEHWCFALMPDIEEIDVDDFRVR